MENLQYCWFRGFSDWSASAISDFSHQDMSWKATEEGDIIDYEFGFK